MGVRDGSTRCVVELIVGAKMNGSKVTYKIKWEDYEWKENCFGDCQNPAEFLVTKGAHLKGYHIKVKYSVKIGWQAGIIREFDRKQKKHEVVYDNKQVEWLDLLAPSKEWELLGE